MIQMVRKWLSHLMKGFHHKVTVKSAQRYNYQIRDNEMKRLCYVYIRDYKNLHDIGVSIDSRYLYSFNAGAIELNVSDNPQYIESFWGDNVVSLAAIVGNNGTGKSNVLRFIIEYIVEGRAGEKPQGFLVCKDENGWSYFSGVGNISIKWKGRDVGARRRTQNEGIKTCFYSSHFSVLDDILNVQLTGYANCTSAFLLKHSVTEYLNKDENQFLSYYEHRNCFVFQDQMKMALFAAHFYRKMSELKIHIPRYLIVSPNKSALHAYNMSVELKNQATADLVAIPNGDFRVQPVLLRIIFHAIQSYFIEQTSKVRANLINDMFDSDMEGKSREDYILRLANKCSITRDFYQKLTNVCKRIEEYFVCESEYGYLDIGDEDGRTKFEAFINECYNARDFLTARFFDITLSDNCTLGTPLSSGEALLYQMLSRIYYSQVIAPYKFDNIEPSSLMVFDEAELGLHPEWQRSYIDMLIKFFNDRTFNPNKVQIIITSHSPIVLSDIPKQYITYIGKDENGATINMTESTQETFASNVFDLYRESFFLQDGLIGKYAELILKDINDVFDKGVALNGEQQKIVEQIGDDRIRNYYMYKMGLDRRISELEKELEKLKKQRKNV